MPHPKQLTDFASARKPTIKTASLSDLMSLSPNDLLTKLRFLFITVMVLFGITVVGAMIGFVLDWDEKRRLLVHLKDPVTGFHAGENGEWLWRLEQAPLKEDLEKPEGTAVHLASVFGMPFCRLRAVLPEHFLPGTMAAALGRRAGLSPSWMNHHQAEHDTLMTVIAAGIKASFGFKRAAKRIPQLHINDHVPVEEDVALAKLEKGAAPAPIDEAGEYDEAPTAADVFGTALAFAFIHCCALLKPAELAKQQVHAAKALRDVPLPGADGWDFEKLLEHFKVLLYSGNLNTRTDWFVRARLWRFIFCQAPDGSWAPSSSVAFALFACEPEELQRASGLPRRKYALLGRIADLFDSDTELFGDGDGEFAEHDDEDEDGERHHIKHRPSQLAHIMGPAFRAWRECAVASRTAKFAARGYLRRDDDPVDCVLTASAAPLCLSLPRELRVLRRRAEAEAARARRFARAEADGSLRMKLSRLTHKLERSPSELASEQKLREALETRSAYVPPKFSSSLETRSAYVPPTFASSSSRLSPDGPADGLATMSASRRTHTPATLKLKLQSLLADGLGADSGLPPSDVGDADWLADTPPAASQRSRRPRTPRGGAASPPPPLDVDRIWTTLLVLSVLERFSECVLRSDILDPEERTIVDAGHAYLDAQAEAHPALRELLASGTLAKKAGSLTAKWQAVLGNRVAEVRATEALTSHMSLAHFQRTSAEVTRALMMRHETFATFLAPAMDGLQRWQLWIILITLVCSQLLVNIWMCVCAREPPVCMHFLHRR